MHKLVITGSNKAEFIEVDIPKISSKQILVKTICTAISTVTEIRVYNGISIDKNNSLMFPTMPWNYPPQPATTLICLISRVYTLCSHN